MWVSSQKGQSISDLSWKKNSTKIEIALKRCNIWLVLSRNTLLTAFLNSPVEEEVTKWGQNTVILASTMSAVKNHQRSKGRTDLWATSWRETGQQQLGFLDNSNPATPRKQAQHTEVIEPSALNHPNLPTQEVSVCFIAKTQQALKLRWFTWNVYSR